MAYRNTIGRVYEEVHRKLAENLQERAALKLKLFLCHIINRVFSGCVNPEVFPFYLTWIKKHNKKISNRYYDFSSIEEWIADERPDNLQRSQDTINQIFYKWIFNDFVRPLIATFISQYFYYAFILINIFQRGIFSDKAEDQHQSSPRGFYV